MEPAGQPNHSVARDEHGVAWLTVDDGTPEPYCAPISDRLAAEVEAAIARGEPLDIPITSVPAAPEM